MKSKEISGVVEGVSNEKGLPKEKVFEAIENAIAFAAEKKYETENGIEILVRAEIDRRTCEYKTYRRWEVVGEDGPLAHPTMQVTLEAARLENPDIQPGEYIEDEVEIKSDDRITVQATRQFLQQKIREAERMEVIEKYRPMVGHIVSGIVKRKNHDRLIVEIGRGIPARPGMPRSFGTEAVLPASQLLPRETALFRVGDHISGLLLDIRDDALNGKGSGLTLSRTDPKFLTEVMRKEVPEIGEDLVEIKAVARMTQARRSKVALFAKDKRIDPIGACVGMKQSRITAIKDELGGEKVDLVKWDDDPIQYVMNAMQPAVVLSVRVDEVKHSMDLAVEEDNLSRAIGTGGQNINLASRLTGWHLNVLSKADFDKQESSEEEKLKKLLTENLNIDDEFAEVLIDEGFDSLENVAYAPVKDLASVEGITEDMARILIKSANDALARIAEERKKSISDDLRELVGSETAEKLSTVGITNLEALCDAATDDLKDIEGMDEKTAGDLIMKARDKCWFSDEAKDKGDSDGDSAKA